jgi:uncharacterized protein (TIGR02996 family)
MNEEQAFLAAIAANPADATARLVFADWLTERDDPRGEWLRVRTQLALGNGTAAELTQLEERERELAPTVLADWFTTDAPVWCLLGGGLPYPPVPDSLTKQNAESWAWVSEYYADFPADSWVSLSGIGPFLATLTRSEVAKLFRAGRSEVTIIVSTADRPGLSGVDEHVWVVPLQKTPRFRLGYEAPRSRYEWPNQSGLLLACDDVAALRSYFLRFLAQLWCDTRGLISIYEM